MSMASFASDGLTSLSFLGLGDGTARLSNTTGQVNERTLSLGQTVVCVDNIGTMRLVEQTKGMLPLWMGIVIVLAALYSMSDGISAGAVLFLAAGGGLLAWHFMRKVETYLLIGTCDGRQTYLVSKDKIGLMKVRDILSEKINKRSMSVASIHLGDKHVNIESGGGGIVIGGGQATGTGGSVHAGTASS